ncbi:MAG TPA: hypothetical protein VGI45_06290 [Terracidiphilus sp.]|jgi:hypothetical protein
MIRFWRFIVVCAACAGLFVIALAASAPFYLRFQRGQGCESCHEMTAHVNAIHGSAHRNTNCMQCHTASLSAKLRHVRVHMTGSALEVTHLRDVDVMEMTAKCQACHQHEFATWQAGPHSANYAQIFTNPVHNAERRLTDDCLRCHGMHFNGAVRDLVQPMNTSGPWHLTQKGREDEPTIPCMACHELHREGSPQARPASRISIATPPVRDSLAFFDRREQLHFPARLLAIPQLWDESRAVKISPDQRQALCYQCHAPRISETGTVAASNHWGPQVGSGDDRTPMGVHEGISCFSCHNGHNESATASCKTCHPQMSHCGIDVEKMDTTFANAKSAHNVHWVRCTDCHQHGVPRPKV